jgi:MoxR-like ATPase
MLSNSQQSTHLGRAIGGPVCGLKLIPLSRPGGPEKTTLEYFGNKCDSHGKEVEFQPAARTAPIELQIAFPDMSLPASDDWEAETVASCTGCANYMPPQATRRATGWSAGFCRKKGKLLLDDRLNTYARTCEDRKFAPRSMRISDTDPTSGRSVVITILPEYDLMFGRPQPVNIHKIHKDNIATPPSQYKSDRPVTEAYKKKGILAFRRVQDPKSYGPDLLIPVMDAGFFDDEDRKRIPQSGDPEKPEYYFDHNGGAYKIFVMWMKLKQTPALWGEPGVGKTELFRHLAWMMGMPFQRISITETSEVDDMIGKMMFSPEKGTYFQYGRIPRGWTRPNILCLDEPNTGQPALWQRIRPLTDDSKQMVVDENNSETLPKHPLCYLGMAMNPAWDPRNTGVAPLADADGSRLMHIKMELPPPEIEKEILLETLTADRWEESDAKKLIQVLMLIAKEIRTVGEEGGHLPSWGIRNQKKVARIKRYMSWMDAFRMGVTDALEPQVAETILAIVSSRAPDEN